MPDRVTGAWDGTARMEGKARHILVTSMSVVMVLMVTMIATLMDGYA